MESRDRPPGQPDVDPEYTKERAAFDESLRRLTPRVVVTPVLLALNVAIFVMMIFTGVDPTDPSTASLIAWGADFGPRTTHGDWWRLLTSNYLHIGFMHLACNMIALLAIGFVTERLLGNVGFALVYTVSGLCGSLASVFFLPYSVSAGASGAIFGLYGALLGFLAGEIRTIPEKVLGKLCGSALTIVFYNLADSLEDGHINIAAHLGGFVAGLLAGLALNHPLTPEAAAGRAKRNLALAAGSAAIVPVAIVLLPPAVDFTAEINHLQAIDILARSGYAQARGHAMLNEDVAALIERDILPDMKEARRRLAAIEKVPAQLEPLKQRMMEFAESRERYWMLLAQALRDDDGAKLREVARELEKSNELAPFH